MKLNKGDFKLNVWKSMPCLNNQAKNKAKSKILSQWFAQKTTKNVKNSWNIVCNRLKYKPVLNSSVNFKEEKLNINRK